MAIDMAGAISNAYPDGNRGGCALTVAALNLASRFEPGCSRFGVFSIYDFEPDAVGFEFRHTLASHPGTHIRPPVLNATWGRRSRLPAALVRTGSLIAAPGRERRRSRSLEALDGCRFVISRGGVIFREGSSHRDRMLLPTRILPALAAVRLGIPTFVYGAHFDELHFLPARSAARLLLRSAAAVVVRDEVSAVNASKEAGKGIPVVVSPDSALDLEARSSAELHALVRTHGLDERRFLVVAPAAGERPREAAEETRVHRAFAATSIRLLDLGMVDRVVLVSQRLDSNGDRLACRMIERAAGDSRVAHLKEDLGPTELIGLYSLASATIGTRLHSTILSICAGTPAIPVSIGPSHRHREVFRQLGLGRYVVESADTATRLDRLLSDILDPNSEHRSQVIEARDDARRRIAAIQDDLHQIYMSTR